MTTLFNPASKNLSIMFKGVIYTIPAMGSSELEDDVASYWMTKIHQFLEVQETPRKVIKTIKDKE